MKDREKHKVVRVDNLMYKGCEPHWKCVKCGICIPFHCYTKEQLENMYCKENNMESEKVKEIKKGLECCKDRLCEVCPRLKQEPNQEEDCRLALIGKSLTLINELEKENANKTDTITDLLKMQEFYETKKLKQFAERLIEDFTKKKNKLIKEREIAAKYDDFILIDALAYKIDELQYAIDNIDETLKECLCEKQV